MKPDEIVLLPVTREELSCLRNWGLTRQASSLQFPGVRLTNAERSVLDMLEKADKLPECNEAEDAMPKANFRSGPSRVKVA